MTHHMTDEELRQAAVSAVKGREDDFPHALAILRVGDLLSRLVVAVETIAEHLAAQPQQWTPGPLVPSPPAAPGAPPAPTTTPAPPKTKP